MLEINGSAFSGSGMIVRQAIAYAALTGTPIHLHDVRARRSHPGLRPQHRCAVEAIRELVGGKLGGLAEEALFAYKDVQRHRDGPDRLPRFGQGDPRLLPHGEQELFRVILDRYMAGSPAIEEHPLSSRGS